MARSDKLSTYKTKVTTDNGVTTVRYHQTNVVQFDANTIILRTGGWRTVTTLRKMSQAMRQFDLGYAIFQKKFEWFVCKVGDWDNALPFDDSVFVIDRREATPDYLRPLLDAAQ